MGTVGHPSDAQLDASRYAGRMYAIGIRDVVVMAGLAGLAEIGVSVTWREGPAERAVIARIGPLVFGVGWHD